MTDNTFITKDLSDMDLSNVNLSGAKLVGVDFSGSKLNGANLSNANLEGANFQDADLTGAKLTDANLRGTRLDNCKVDNTGIGIIYLGRDTLVYHVSNKYPNKEMIFLGHLGLSIESWKLVGEEVFIEKGYSLVETARYMRAIELVGRKSKHKLLKVLGFLIWSITAPIVLIIIGINLIFS